MIPAIGFAARGDEPALRKLYQTCFPEDEAAFWNWIFQHPYRPENTLVIREGGALAASLQMIPCGLCLQQEQFAAHYIYAAATAPAFRGQGRMAKLLSEAAALGRAKGHRFSVLITQEDSLLDYYAQFGYLPRLFCRRESALDEPGFPNEKLRQAEKGDIPALNGIYEASCGELLHGVRTSGHWLTQMELFSGGVWLLERKGSVCAYGFFDERGCAEAAGEGAERLVCRVMGPGGTIQSPPRGEGIPMGCIRPLDPGASALLLNTQGYLNLMYN